MGDTDFRSMVEGAYAEAETQGIDTPDAGQSAPAESADPGVGEAPPEGGHEAVEAGAVAERTAAERARDKAGRFAPKGKDAPLQTKQVAKQGGQPAPASVPDVDAASLVPPAPVRKAPQSWTPGEREHFAKAPPEVQAAVERREREVAMALQEAAPAKRFQQEVSQALRPYEQFAQRIGTTPIALAQQASQVALQISEAPPHVAAKVFADLIRSRPDIQLELINSHLAGQPEQPGPTAIDPVAIAQQAEQRVWQRINGERQKNLQSRFEQEVSDFASDPKNEFFAHEEHGPEIQRRVLGLIQATNHLPANRQPSLSDIYGDAVMAYGPTRAIMQKREAAERAKASAASTQQARLAASSVKSTPSTGASSVQTPKTIREMVQATYEGLDGSR